MTPQANKSASLKYSTQLYQDQEIFRTCRSIWLFRCSTNLRTRQLWDKRVSNCIAQLKQAEK